MRGPGLIAPRWPAPTRVRAMVSTRRGGVSDPPFDTLNLGDHVGDAAAAVTENRRRLRAALDLDREPAWLEQVHGTRVRRLDDDDDGPADASVTLAPGPVCALLTADCLPVLLCDRAGTRVGAAHAGWRGLAAGVVEATVRAMACDGADLLAWLGPAIGPAAFQVGAEVRTQFLAHDPAASAAFVPSGSGKYLADLFALARRRLAALGVTAVYGGGVCTYSDARRFFSHRRDGRCGRIASLIWLEG